MSREASLGGETPDAGTTSRPQRGEGVREYGAIVVDADSSVEFDERDRAVVVNTPPVECSEWTIYRSGGEEVTVADDNPAYDSSSEVVVVAFLQDLTRDHPDWDATQALDLPLECASYAFPPRRLQRVGTYPDPDEGHKRPTTPADRLTPEQERLRERLEESGGVAIAPDPDDKDRAIIIFEKLGSEYTIDADGVVSDGPIAARIEKVAAEFLGCESE
jgi:hypothetical protein